jgi:hypothetical protein
MTEDEEFRIYLAERDELFRKPTLQAAQAWWKKAGNPQWARYDVPLSAVHKARLQWLDATDTMLFESYRWLKKNGYDVEMSGAPPLTPESRDAQRKMVGKEPLKGKV